MFLTLLNSFYFDAFFRKQVIMYLDLKMFKDVCAGKQDKKTEEESHLLFKTLDEDLNCFINVLFQLCPRCFF